MKNQQESGEPTEHIIKAIKTVDNQWLDTKYKISMFYMFIELSILFQRCWKYEGITWDYQNWLYLKKDQIELLEMWNTAISIKTQWVD